jgi:hypothetical protein
MRHSSVMHQAAVLCPAATTSMGALVQCRCSPAGPELDSADEDAHSRPALGAAIKALQAAFWDRDGPPVVVFDGLHAEDLPASEQVHKAVQAFYLQSSSCTATLAVVHGHLSHCWAGIAGFLGRHGAANIWQFILHVRYFQESATWDGSLDFGEQLGASYMAASEAVEREPDVLGSGELGGGGSGDAAAALGSRIAGLPGLPAGRRVSLLAGWV